MINICISGGARGADITFGDTAENHGHKVEHIHHNPDFIGRRNFRVMSPAQLEMNDPFIKRANKILERRFPCRSLDATNLIRRNVYQVIATDTVYAISAIEDDMKTVKGGTGWAVEFFKLFNPNGNIDTKKMFVYCQERMQWFKWNQLKYTFEDMGDENPPRPSGVYTGIGSRELTGAGLKAIYDLYKD